MRCDNWATGTGPELLIRQLKHSPSFPSAAYPIVDSPESQYLQTVSGAREQTQPDFERTSHRHQVASQWRAVVAASAHGEHHGEHHCCACAMTTELQLAVASHARPLAQLLPQHPLAVCHVVRLVQVRRAVDARLQLRLLPAQRVLNGGQVGW